jgi:hypothetical protein
MDKADRLGRTPMSDGLATHDCVGQILESLKNRLAPIGRASGRGAGAGAPCPGILDGGTGAVDARLGTFGPGRGLGG